ncbi:hypothetical protein MBLNU13_g02431t1 [Cladosporium sp. NU13]
MDSNQVEKQPLLEEQSGPEPTLAELQQNVQKAQRAYMRAWSRSTNGKWHRRIIFSVTGLLFFFMFFCMSIIAVDVWNEDDTPYSSGRVPLEAFIMSKCPDARDCLHDMILPAMQNVSHKVDFRLSYIGSVTQNDGVSCMHGPQECLGNMLELCAARQYPNPKIYLGFTMCMSNSYEDIPSKELVEECALEHGMSFERLHDCATAEDGAVGVDMLRTSFNRTAALGIKKSCTVTVADSIFAIRDGGEWTDLKNGSSAADLVAEIERLYSLPNYSDW